MPSDEHAALNWGTTREERSAPWSCDRVLRGDASYYRGVDVAAAPATVFRWLCQLRVAPYSYDVIDNRARRSPPHLVPGLEELEVGQTFMTIFTLTGFTPGTEITLLTKPGRAERLFGRVAVTYRATPTVAAGATRLLAKVNVDYPDGLWGRMLRRVLPWGDLVMMRKQLLTLKRLAEASPGRSADDIDGVGHGAYQSEENGSAEPGEGEDP